MESEAIITQDVVTPANVEEAAEASIAAEESVPSPTTEPEAAQADAGEPASEPEAASADEPEAVAEVVADEQPEEAASEGDEAEAEASVEEAPVDVVATEDVSHAQTQIDLARIAKEALIQRAKEMAESTDWRKTSEQQRALMEEWRKVGYAGKDANDRLWEEFRAARQEFFSRREAEVVQIKKGIIEEARALTAEVSNWNATASKLDGLMDRWKAAGNSGNDADNELWSEFNGIRRDFRNRRKADLDQRRATTAANAQAKAAIVEEATAIADSAQYTRENSDRMRELDKAYRAIGFAGRPANDDLWKQFGDAKNRYWKANSAHLDQRRKQRSERLQEVVERKADQIEVLKTQNETLTARLGSTLNPDKIAQLKQWIAENEERVEDLQDDIGEIKSKI